MGRPRSKGRYGLKAETMPRQTGRGNYQQYSPTIDTSNENNSYSQNSYTELRPTEMVPGMVRRRTRQSTTRDSINFITPGDKHYLKVKRLVFLSVLRNRLAQVDMHIDDWASSTPGPASHKRRVRGHG